jgi:trehalose 6-phosphate phosphatase
MDPARSAVVTDFDGTISAIVDDPAGARALAGAADRLKALARRFGVVAVVSGRPVSFLTHQLAPTGRRKDPDPAVSGSATRGVRFVGLYGLEWSDGDGGVVSHPGTERWGPVVTDTAGRLRSDAPPGVVVEPKGLAVTLHWRQAPEAEAWSVAASGAESARTGLQAHHGRMSIELRPPLAVDKGSVTRGLVEGCAAACYLGDDLGDLPAFSALADLRAEQHMITVSVAVVDDESPAEVREAADVTVSGPGEALALLGWLAGT